MSTVFPASTLPARSPTSALVADTGTAGYSGDGGPPESAQLNGPGGVAVSEDGSPIYIVDTGNHPVRKIGPGFPPPGLTITTYAGTGTAGFSGDGGAATSAPLDDPRAVVWHLGQEALYIADRGNHGVRRVDRTGSISTWAGSGAAGLSGDGGLARQANTGCHGLHPRNLPRRRDGGVRPMLRPVRPTADGAPDMGLQFSVADGARRAA